jgi:hypothetical protein
MADNGWLTTDVERKERIELKPPAGYLSLLNGAVVWAAALIRDRIFQPWKSGAGLN